MDIRLPGENGLELIKKIKMNYPDVTVVILTSYNLPEYRQAALQNKADYFVTKDSPTQNFLALVESFCTNQKHDGNKPLSDKRTTHGLCPKHLKISSKKIKAEMGKEERR